MSGRKCAVCGKPVEQEYRPFCSKRCADLDLARWLGGDYRIPTDEPAFPEDGVFGDGSDEPPEDR